MDFDARIAEYQRSITKALGDFFEEAFSVLPTHGDSLLKLEQQLARDMCIAPGKRLRPILTLAAYRASGGKQERSMIRPALAFEILHNYTLVHDDIYDEDNERRHQPASYARLASWYAERTAAGPWRNALYHDRIARFGVIAGFLNGEYLHNLSSMAIHLSKLPPARKVEGLRLLSRVALGDNTGQLLDLELEDRANPTARDYLLVIAENTNHLFMSSAEWGAILAGGTDAARTALRQYGAALGYAYKLKDDLLDIGIGGDKGRLVGSDIRKGKRTLLLLHALKHAPPRERQFLRRVVGRNAATPKDIERVIGSMHEYGSVESCRQAGNTYVRNAKHALRTAKPAFAASDRRFLEELVEWSFGRNR